MKGRNRGATLTELAMASFLLGIVLTVSGRLAWLASRSKTSSEAQNRTFREASIALERIQRESLHCQQIYAPSSPFPVEYQPSKTRPLVLRTRTSTDPIDQTVVAYYLDGPKEELRRFTYKADFDPQLASKQIIDHPAKVVATGVVSWQVIQPDPATRYNCPVIRYDLVVRDREAKRSQHLPLSTEVRLAQ